MRSTEERMLAVRRRSSRLRRHRGGRALAVLAFLMALPVVDLVGRYAAGNLAGAPSTENMLFGAASLFGASVGGYVLAVVIAAVITVVVTAFLMMRRGSRGGAEDDGERRMNSKNKEEQEGASDEE